MVIHLPGVRSLLWFVAVLALALTFPLQVYFGSPYVALFPYLIVGLVVMVGGRSFGGDEPDEPRTDQRRSTRRLVGVFAFLVVLNTIWQVGLGVITPAEGASAFFGFLPPVVLYEYFRRRGSAQEVRSVLWAVAVAGLLVGLFFAYDSYLKLALHQVSDYSVRAYEYSVARGGVSSESGASGRISLAFRSFGPLETHSVSGAWVVLGALAALALPSRRSRFVRRLVVLSYGTMLLIGLNFTTIAAFALIAFLFEFGGISLLRGRLSIRALGNLGAIVPLVALLIGGASWLVGEAMLELIAQLASAQTQLALGTSSQCQVIEGAYRCGSILSLMVFNAGVYLRELLNAPWTLLVGDGFSTYGMSKGGDIGFIESLARLGVPFFVTAGWSLLALIGAGARQLASAADAARDRNLQFAVCVALLVVVSEAHYSVWAAKSVLPVLFFSLALFGRSVPRPASGADVDERVGHRQASD